MIRFQKSRGCKWQTVTMLVGMLAFSSCGKKDDSGSDDRGVFKDMALIGNWQNSCLDEEDSFRERIELRSNTLIWHYDAFSQKGCKSGDSYGEEVATYNAISPINPPDIEGWKTAKVEVASITYTVKTKSLAEYASEKKWFGYTDWQPNVPRDITGRKSIPDDPDRKPRRKVNQVVYMTFTIENDKLLVPSYKNNQTLRSDSPQDTFSRM